MEYARQPCKRQHHDPKFRLGTPAAAVLSGLRGSQLLHLANLRRSRAMISGRGVAKAPDDVVVERGPVARQFPVGVVALTGFSRAARRLTTAIPIRDDEGPAVLRVEARAEPRDRRGLGPRRA